MNDYVSLLLQGCAAKRKLAELFQSEGFGQENQPPIAIAAHESVPSVQSGIRQTSESFRENCRKHGLIRNRIPLRTSQPGQKKRDLTVSGLVFALVLIGVILAANTEQPVFWLLIGPVPVAVLHTLRAFLRQVLRRHEGPLAFYERDRMRISNPGVSTLPPDLLRRTFLSQPRLLDRAGSVSSSGCGVGLCSIEAQMEMGTGRGESALR